MTDLPTLYVELVDGWSEAPEYMTPGAAGMDLFASNSVDLPAGEWRTVSAGIRLEIPPGHVGMICSRSGLAARQGIVVLNAPGIIDSDFRGDVKVILINLSKEDCKINVGDRIAQMVVTPYVRFKIIETAYLTSTNRGDKGFGSTGK